MMNTLDNLLTATRARIRNPSLARASRSTVVPLAVTVLVALLGARAVVAAEVTVQVSKRGSSEPLGNVAVCLGTRSAPAQFGATLTDRSGIAKFSDLPTTEIILTASKPGLRGQRRSLLTSPWDRALAVSLPAGGGGPKCAAVTPAAAAAATTASTVVDSTGLGIRAFRINKGRSVTRDPAVTLDFSYSGDATHYRVSERSDFGAAEWRPIDAEHRFDLSAPAGRKTVYLQVRRHITVHGGEMQSVSNVARDSIVLEGG